MAVKKETKKTKVEVKETKKTKVDFSGMSVRDAKVELQKLSLRMTRISPFEFKLPLMFELQSVRTANFRL